MIIFTDIFVHTIDTIIYVLLHKLINYCSQTRDGMFLLLLYDEAATYRSIFTNVAYNSRNITPLAKVVLISCVVAVVVAFVYVDCC